MHAGEASDPDIMSLETELKSMTMLVLLPPLHRTLEAMEQNTIFDMMYNVSNKTSCLKVAISWDPTGKFDRTRMERLIDQPPA